MMCGGWAVIGSNLSRDKSSVLSGEGIEGLAYYTLNS